MAMIGNLPTDLGLIDINPIEMMFWLYCPIKVAKSHSVQLPQNLMQYEPIIDMCFRDIKATKSWINEFQNEWYDSYVYLTAKTLFVSDGYIGNRPGWHCDGFGTDDINYIWYDSAPTDFLKCRSTFNVTDDCGDSIVSMEASAELGEYVQYPDKHLLKLDPTVIHRSPVDFNPGVRTFVKVSVSKDVYNLEGNSINHNLPIETKFLPRGVERNHPCKDFE